jgi:hypothetical protein
MEINDDSNKTMRSADESDGRPAEELMVADWGQAKFHLATCLKKPKICFLTGWSRTERAHGWRGRRKCSLKAGEPTDMRL